MVASSAARAPTFKGLRMTCLTCQHIGLKAFPAMSKLGFGRCVHDSVGVFKSLSSTCDKHAAADPQIVALREAWAAQRTGGNK